MHKVAIVGRPNVGKSSLFNRLIGRREAVVADYPGVTRDVKDGLMLYENHRIVLMDTGGLWSGDVWEASIHEKAAMAIDDALVVLFMTDPREGLTTADYEVADWLRKMNKPVITVANKIDSLKHEVYLAELYGLGFGDPIAISAEHARGLDELLEKVMEYLPVDDGELSEVAPIRISLIGRPNVGKSSLLNAIVGQERVIVAETPGTTRDSIDIEWNYGGQRFVLVDTAGIRKRPEGFIEEYAMMRSEASIKVSDVIWLVVNAGEIGDHELKLANLAYESGKPVIIIVNKWDLVPDEMLRATEKLIDDKLFHISFAPRVYTSALNDYGVHEMLAEAMKLYAKWQSRVPTGELNKWLEVWTIRGKIPNFKGRALKMYFMTQAETAPPTFVIFCNNDKFVVRSFENYLQNRIREDLELAGVPVRIVWRVRGIVQTKEERLREKGEKRAALEAGKEAKDAKGGKKEGGRAARKADREMRQGRDES